MQDDVVVVKRVWEVVKLVKALLPDDLVLVHLLDKRWARARDSRVADGLALAARDETHCRDYV